MVIVQSLLPCHWKQHFAPCARNHAYHINSKKHRVFVTCADAVHADVVNQETGMKQDAAETHLQRELLRGI
jgi:hypothetical protein